MKKLLKTIRRIPFLIYEAIVLYILLTQPFDKQESLSFSENFFFRLFMFIVMSAAYLVVAVCISSGRKRKEQLRKDRFATPSAPNAPNSFSNPFSVTPTASPVTQSHSCPELPPDTASRLIPCPVCSKLISPTAVSCPNCGNQMSQKLITCRYCGGTLAQSATQCPHCAAPNNNS